MQVPQHPPPPRNRATRRAQARAERRDNNMAANKQPMKPRRPDAGNNRD